MTIIGRDEYAMLDMDLGSWTKHCGGGVSQAPHKPKTNSGAHALKWELVLIPPTYTSINKVCTGTKNQSITASIRDTLG